MSYNPIYRTASPILMQLAVGGSALIPSAILGLTSTTQGLGLPAMTQSQMNAIASPVPGLFVYLLDKQSTAFFNGGVWQGMPAVTLPTVVDSIPVFSNTVGSQKDTGVFIGSNPVGLNNLFWAEDGVSSIGESEFFEYSPNAVPSAIVISNTDNIVVVVGSFTTSGYLVPFDTGLTTTTDFTGVPQVNTDTEEPLDVVVGGTDVTSAFFDSVNNRLYVAGSFTSIGVDEDAATNLGAFDMAAGGTPIDGFSSGSGPGGAAGPMTVDTTAAQVYVFNPSENYNGSASSNLIRVDGLTGDLDVTWNTAVNNFDGAITGLMLDPNNVGSLVVVGSFTHYGATAAPGICRLNSTGVLDGTFTPGTGFTGGSPQCLYITATGYYVGGTFTGYNGTAVVGFARITTAGALDGTFPNGVDGSVFAIAFDSTSNPNTGGNALWIGGEFTTFNGNSSYENLLFISETGQNLFNSLGGQACMVNGQVTAICMQSGNFGGNVYIAGSFDTFTDVNGTITTGLSNFVLTNSFDGSNHPFGVQSFARPKTVFAEHSFQAGGNFGDTFPFGDLRGFYSTSNANGPTGFFNSQTIVGHPNVAPTWLSAKSQGGFSSLSDIQRDGEGLAFFDAYGLIGNGFPVGAGSYEALGGMHIFSDQGQGGRVEWYTKTSIARAMWLDSQQSLNMIAEIQWPTDGQGDIGRLNESQYNVATLNGIQFTTVVGTSAALAPQNITVVFANDGTAGHETVTIVGTYPPVQAPVTVTVHMQAGVSTVYTIVTALNGNSSVVNNLFNSYMLGRNADTVAAGTVTFGSPNLMRPGSVHAAEEMSIGGEAYHTRQFAVNTTDNGQTNTLDIDLNVPDVAMLVEARVVARWTGGAAGSEGDLASFVVRALCSNIAASPSVIEVSSDIYTVNPNLSVDIIFVGSNTYTNGFTFSVAVTGDTDNNYSWSGTVITQQV